MDNINEQIKNKTMRDKLAIELMEKLDKKYNMNNVISLDEYVYEYFNLLTENDFNFILGKNFMSVERLELSTSAL